MPPTEFPPAEAATTSSRSWGRRARFAALPLAAIACLPLLWPKLDAAGRSTPPQTVHSAARPHAAPSNAKTEKKTAAVPAHRLSARDDAQPAGKPIPDGAQDEQHRRAALGVWTQYNHGPRTLTLREDGTGTMQVEPAGAWAYVIGAKVTMQIEWKVENGRAVMNSISGHPLAAFQAVTQLFGKERNREIVELTDEKLVLLDNEDGSTSEWTRAEQQ